MGNINETSSFDDNINQVEIEDPVAGGVSGPVNLSLRGLTNRTRWLKNACTSMSELIAAIKAQVGDGNMSDTLKKASNLSDVADKAAARTNLGVSASDHNHDAVYLKKTSNLSDVASAATARQNLGVADFYFVKSAPAASLGKNGDIAVQQMANGTPVMYKKDSGVWTPVISSVTCDLPGMVRTYAGATVPAGYLKCDGKAYSRTAYAALFAAIGTRYGLGDGSSTFNVPDCRGDALRYYDDGRGIDAGRALGSEQMSQNKSHTHGLSTGKAAAVSGHTHDASTGSAGTHSHSGSTSTDGNHNHLSVGFTGGGLSGFSDSDNNNAQNMPTSYAGAHSHSLSINGAGDHTHSVTVGSAGGHEHTLSGNSDAEGGSEARMRNIAFMGIIKY